MTSLCRHLSAQDIVNWATTADGCIHTADATKQFRRVGGVYWALYLPRLLVYLMIFLDTGTGLQWLRTLFLLLLLSDFLFPKALSFLNRS